MSAANRYTVRCLGPAARIVPSFVCSVVIAVPAPAAPEVAALLGVVDALVAG